MSNKQSSVEWFFSELERVQYFIGNDMLEAYKQAKAMHKEEHRNTFNQGLMSNFQNFEEYYNETFNTKEK